MPLDGGNLPLIFIKDRGERVPDVVAVRSTCAREILKEHGALNRRRRDCGERHKGQKNNGTSSHSPTSSACSTYATRAGTY
jgi:hypothetical protein